MHCARSESDSNKAIETKWRSYSFVWTRTVSLLFYNTWSTFVLSSEKQSRTLLLLPQICWKPCWSRTKHCVSYFRFRRKTSADVYALLRWISFVYEHIWNYLLSVCTTPVLKSMWNAKLLDEGSTALRRCFLNNLSVFHSICQWQDLCGKVFQMGILHWKFSTKLCIISVWFGECAQIHKRFLLPKFRKKEWRRGSSLQKEDNFCSWQPNIHCLFEFVHWTLPVITSERLVQNLYFEKMCKEAKRSIIRSNRNQTQRYVVLIVQIDDRVNRFNLLPQDMKNKSCSEIRFAIRLICRRDCPT